MKKRTYFRIIKPNSRSYNPKLSEEENYKKFKEEYADKISQAKDQLIKDDLREFHLMLQNLKEYEGPLYYASDGVNVYTNSTKTEKEQFKTYPSYMIFEEYKREIYPKEIKENEYLNRITERIDDWIRKAQVVYVAFTEEFLNQKVKEWKENKVQATNSFYTISRIFSRIYPYHFYI